ncbi:MAG: hypothetical protein LBP51_08200 [Deferribacteraceae bacterium]|jgi:replicative DNA helicase|nr:hypothetical protein [Deferribacteraceae bacterium]
MDYPFKRNEDAAEQTQNPFQKPIIEPTQYPFPKAAEQAQNPFQKAAEPAQNPFQKPIIEPTQYPFPKAAEQAQNPFQKAAAEPAQSPFQKPIIEPTQYPFPKAAEQAQNPFQKAAEPAQHPFQKSFEQIAKTDNAPTQEPSALFTPTEPSAPQTEALSSLNILSKPNSLISYIKNIFLTDLSQYSNIGNRKTGFPNLDAECGMLYPGLYVLGAASSMGKTTFIHQLSDNLAERGAHVLYFSLIQSKFELTVKSICRLIARKNGGRNGLTEPEIWMLKTPSQEVQAALDSYTAMIADRISIFDNSEELTMDRITEIVRSYIVDNNIHPVVIVDNIQHLPPKHTAHLSNNHLNLHSLKNLQQKEHLTIVAVSNIDTDSYFRHIDFDSFLNSGGIEYTADVIWGLQIQAARETEKAQSKIDARERFFSAKSLVPRKMELICLKNNFGKSVYTCYFDYYPQYNIFVEEKRVEVEKVVVERL